MGRTPTYTGMPVHIAIIMDGNGRWARARHRPRVFGHSEGVKTVRRVVEGASEIGVKCLTLYSFSTENWTRPKAEITALFNLLREYVESDLDTLHGRNVRVRILGSRSGLSPDLLSAAGWDLATMKESEFDPFLDTAGLPDVDLVIRTSGEKRISNFLLWQAAYAEFVFTDVLWPDFDIDDLNSALNGGSAYSKTKVQGRVGSLYFGRRLSFTLYCPFLFWWMALGGSCRSFWRTHVI